MSEPILIIHGVANHDPKDFNEAVGRLQQQIDATWGNSWELLPVFWGDLGGASSDIADCLPILRNGAWEVRSGEPDTWTALSPQVAQAVAGPGSLSNEDRAALIAAPAATSDEAITRSEPTSTANEEIAAAARAELPSTQVLQFVDDPTVLQSLGEVIRTAVQDADNDLVGYQYETRGLSVLGIAQRLIHSVDNLLGKFVGNQLGMANQHLRAEIAGPFAGFAGDIIVYQRNQAKIQARIREVLAAYNSQSANAGQPAYGTPERPIHAIGHSLGGVILFDTAVAPAAGLPLWLKSLTTFGSQAAFFHIIDPRVADANGQLVIYQRDHPVQLPKTIKRWVNLWDTLDVLAFTAGTVFRLSDGSRPLDIPVRDALSELWHYRLWLHSVYWETSELHDALKLALAS